MINNPDNPKKCMYKMIKTDKNCLLEDLIVTGNHSILVDDTTLLDNTIKNYKVYSKNLLLSSILKKSIKLININHKVDGKYLLLSSKSKDFIKLKNTNLYTY